MSIKVGSRVTVVSDKPLWSGAPGVGRQGTVTRPSYAYDWEVLLDGDDAPTDYFKQELKVIA